MLTALHLTLLQSVIILYEGRFAERAPFSSFTALLYIDIIKAARCTALLTAVPLHLSSCCLVAETKKLLY